MKSHVLRIGMFLLFVAARAVIVAGMFVYVPLVLFPATLLLIVMFLPALIVVGGDFAFDLLTQCFDFISAPMDWMADAL